MRINGIELPDMRVVEGLESFGVRAEVKYTRGGKPYVWESVFGGRKITFKGDAEWPWISHEKYGLVKSLAETPGGIWLLEYSGGTVSVRFRNEEPPAVSGEAVWDHVDVAGVAEWVCNVEFRLMVVA